MRQIQRLAVVAGASALLIAGPAAAGCGLDVSPAAMDTNHDQQLSRAETRASPLARVFDRVDRNGDGAISQPEYAHRCASLRESSNAGWAKGWEDTAPGRRVERQRQRQSNRIDDRVKRESDRAADSVVDKAMGALFGD